MFDSIFQDRVMACMKRVPEFMAVASQHMLPEYFDGVPRKNLCKMMRDFWANYGTPLTSPAMMTIIGEEIKKGMIKEVELKAHLSYWNQINKPVISDWKYVLDQMIDFIKEQRIKSLIAEAAKTYIPKGQFTTIEQEMAKIASITAFNRVAAYDYFDKAEIEERHKAREHLKKAGKIAISTGIPALDKLLHAGGFYQKELYIFKAPPKRGKTMSLCWFSNQAALQGYNVAHFSCEVSREILCKRFDAMNSKTLIKEVDAKSREVANRIAGKTVRGKLIILEYPTKSLTPQMIEAEVDRLLVEQGIKIDMVTVDYLDICRLAQLNAQAASWADQGPLAEELRGIAGKKCVPVVTATQTGRAAAGKSTSSGKDVAGDYGKIMIADEIFSISATDEEVKEGKLRISNNESRNSEMATIVISTGFAYGQFFMEYLGEE
jgi:replicative DNA helicase